jgi:hypothetical protein
MRRSSSPEGVQQMSRWSVVPLVALVALVVAAGALAKPISVTFEERAGDAPAPELDIHAATLSYDRATGGLAGAVTLGAAPTSAVIAAIDIDLGRYALANGRCYPIDTATVFIPDADDVEAGLPFPYTKLYHALSANPIGFLPTATNGPTIDFNTLEADPAVVSAIKRGRYACAAISTLEPVNLDRPDSVLPVPLIAGPLPACRIGTRAVSGGGSFPIRCTHAGKRVQVRLYKRGTLLKGTERVRRGRFRVPTTASMRGRWHITIWKGDVVIGRFLSLKVR